jgi:hypothetical protein
MSNDLINKVIQEKLFQSGISIEIDQVPSVIQIVNNLTAIQQFIVDIDDNHPAHELTEAGDIFFTSLKDILIKNLDTYDMVSYNAVHYEFKPTLSFYNSKTNEIKSYSMDYKVFKISQYINEDYQNGKFKEYDRSLFVVNFDSGD